jgi:hypothetical protein
MANESDNKISIYIPDGDDINDVGAIIDGFVFISIDDVSEKLGVVPKEIGEEMLGLCKDEICIFVQMDSRDHVRDTSGRLMINAELIGQALNSSSEWIIPGKLLRFVSEDHMDFDNVIKPDDLVPNFVLPSVKDGKMVSFNSFRGKRVLLFLWASW